MDNSLMVILMAIFGGLTAAGVITALIMKKAKASENAVTIAFLASSFFALIAAGMLVFVVSVNMMKDFVSIRQYREYTIENEEKTVSLTVKEFVSNDSSGFELYKQGQEEMLSEIKTDGYLPFAAGEYELEWTADSVTITYTDLKNEDSYRAMQVTVDIAGGTVSEPKISSKDLRELKSSNDEKSESVKP